MPAPRPSLTRYRLLGGMALIAALVALGFAGAYVNLRNSALAAQGALVDQRVEEVGRELQLTHDVYMDEVHDTMRSLQAAARARGEPSIDGTAVVAGKTVPNLQFGTTAATGRRDMVDDTIRMANGTATIFVRSGADFVRVMTNIRRKDGSRAVGTVLDPKGAVYPVVDRGDAYYGVADVLGRSYITGYEPIRDAANAVVGLYYVGFPIETLGRIGDALADARVLNHGFYVLLDQNNNALFSSRGVDPAAIKVGVSGLSLGESRWSDGIWQWRQVRFPEWRFTLLTATLRKDVEDQTWRLILPVFGYLAPFILAAFLLVYVFIRRLTVTMRRAARLQEEAAKLALVVSRTHNGVVITRPDRTIEWVNEGFTRLSGYSLAEAMDRRPDAFLFGPETAADAANVPREARLTNKSFQIDVLSYHKTGRKVWVHVDGQPIFDDQGKLLNYISTMIDITRRKQMEEELLHAREAAEAASRTKSAFLANMSHELRTPMNAIIGYSEMLIEEAEELEPDEFVPDLQKINAAGKHLLGLINDVLDISKIEAGKATLYLEDFAITTLAAEVASTIQPLVAKNDNRLEVLCPPEVGRMRADVTKIRQTLFNLLSNAAKFTHQGKITFSISREHRDGRDWIKFDVADTGIGMTPEQRGRLFQAFVQADASTTRKYGGTGLGLVISRHFCQMMGGDIAIKSELGQGTVFTVILPAEVVDSAATALAPAAAAPAQAEPEPAAAASNAPLVLVVDDDPAVTDLLSRNLTKDGYAVRVAHSGALALSLAAEFQPQLITLDVMMPSMDGWAVLTALKTNPTTKEIPVVMLSIVDDKPLGLTLGAADYLTKPVDRNRLSEILIKFAPLGSSRLALVIDDLRDNRAMLRKALEREGWTVLEADNGRTGFDSLKQMTPDLILLDLMMPVMSGFEFLQELRRDPAGQSIPVVVVTAKELMPEEEQMLRANVQSFVHKGQGDVWAEVREKIAAATRAPVPPK